jgi:hypothetical protein
MESYQGLMNDQERKLKINAIMNVMRVLKRLNPGDTYYEAYQGHLERSGEEFYDIYIFMWELAACHPPKRILEIGTRTGISLCQLLSAYRDHSAIERIVSIDIYADGFTSPALVKRSLNYLNLPTEKVDLRKGSSLEILPQLYEEGALFDYILVDGDHAKPAAKMDLENADKLCEPGGFIVFDDISTAPGECGLIDVWEAFQQSHEDQYSFFKNMAGKGVGFAVKK